MKRGIMALGAAAIWTIAHPALAKESKQQQRAREMIMRAPDALLPLIKVEGDSLDPSYTVSTYGVSAVVDKTWAGSTTHENSFLRAIIDKKTGAAVVQLYHVARYSGSGWNFFERASYDSPDGLISVRADRLGSDVNCGRYGCTYYEDVAFEIPLATIEAMSKKYDPVDPMMGMKYRLFAKSGVTADDVVPINEIVAFTLKINEVRAKIVLPGTAGGMDLRDFASVPQ